MKNARQLSWVLFVLLAGGAVTAFLEWRQDRVRAADEASHTAERLVSLVSLYPLAEADDGARQLLMKTLVEQSGSQMAYLIINGAVPVLAGNPGLRVSSGGTGQAGGVSSVNRFRSPDGDGDIVEFRKPLRQGKAGASVILGLRVPKPALVSASRISSIAAVLFFMLSALIVGYYVIWLSARRLSRLSEVAAGPAAERAGAHASDSLLSTMERMNTQLTSIHNELQQTHETNAHLSSRLGLACYEARQAYRILDGLDAGILILDAQDRIQHANAAILRLLGDEKESLQGLLYGDVIRNDAVRALLDAQQDSPSSQGLDVQFPETAPERTFHMDCHPLTDGEGDTIGTLLTTQDVTRLVRSHRAQEDFIAEVTHELLTPLTSIKAFADLLVSGAVDDEATQRDFYNTINNETDRLTALIQNLLNVARMETGSLTIERSLVKTDWLLDQCLPAVEAAASKKQITLEKRLPDTFPTIMGDKELLKVVLVNILGNAVKYTPDAGTVRVTMHEQDHSVFFEVSDTGCGIPSDDLPRVFEKFYRGSSSDVRDQIGSGIGLATALQIATLHGGSIDVESEMGKGSCFTVKIPAEEYSFENQ